MKAIRFIVILTLSVSISPSPGWADCGKIPIPRCDEGDNPSPDNGDGKVDYDPYINDDDAGEDIFDELVDDEGNVVLPEGEEVEMLDAAGALGGFFKEDLQQAVIGWNGQQEILILSTNEQSLVGNTPMLSVMPLPGKPLDIRKADKKAFARAKKLVLSKARINTKAGSLGVFMERRIGSHNIFVWKIEDLTKFPTLVQAYVSRKFGGRGKALITDKTLRVIKSYHGRGFRYFAFDLVIATDQKSTKDAISYHFASNFCYYPMVISSAGGTGNTVAELVVFTKTELSKLRGLKRDKIIKIGDKTVAVEQDELRSIDRRLASLFAPGSRLTGRILAIPGKLQDFREDFIAE